MAAFEHALVLLLLIASLSVIARWLPWPPLITYLLGGVGAALLPAFPRLKLDPGFFFLCFLPPLLFSDGWLMPLREFVRAKRAILTLAIGLVIFTTVTVGLVAWWLVPGLPLAMAFALGAIVSPTDAVAVNAITERLRVPARLTTVLNGESLMNDATGLVAFKFALAAAVGAGFSLTGSALTFSLLSLGGFAAGLGVGYAIGKLRDLLQHLQSSDPLIEITLSLLTPFAAYLAAELAGVSGILAVVAAGLYAGWRDPVRTDVETRQTTFAVWGLLIFWLNGIAFVLL
ncbi:MAG: cation:proton antiporter, partial [Opitutus sp.]